MDSSSDADEVSQIQKPRDDADADMEEYDIQGQTVDEIDLEEADQEPLPTSCSQEHSADMGIVSVSIGCQFSGLLNDK